MGSKRDLGRLRAAVRAFVDAYQADDYSLEAEVEAFDAMRREVEA